MPGNASSRKFYKRATIHSLLKSKFRCKVLDQFSHPEKTFWTTPSGEPFDLMEPEFVSTHRDPVDGRHFYTAEYLSAFLLNLLRSLGADAVDLDFVMDELGLNAHGKVRLVKEPKH